MKIVAALLGITLVVVGGLAIHFSHEIDAGQQQLADLKVQLQERDARIATLTATPVTPPAAAVTDLAPQAAAQPAVSSPAAVQDLMKTIREQSASPEAMARLRLTTRSLIESSNPDIGEALGLSPDEEGKLLDLLAAHQASSSAAFMSSIEGNSTTTVQERSAALQAQQQANDAELQARLGSKYSQWKDYNETRAAWQQRRDLRAVLDAGGIPMTDAQSKSLITALAAEARNVTEESREAASQGRPVSEVVSRYTPERRQRLLDAAAPHLSPQQLVGYRGMIDRAAAQEQSRVSTLQAAEARAAAARAGAQ